MQSAISTQKHVHKEKQTLHGWTDSHSLASISCSSQSAHKNDTKYAQLVKNYKNGSKKLKQPVRRMLKEKKKTKSKSHLYKRLQWLAFGLPFKHVLIDDLKNGQPYLQILGNTCKNWSVFVCCSHKSHFHSHKHPLSCQLGIMNNSGVSSQSPIERRKQENHWQIVTRFDFTQGQ